MNTNRLMSTNRPLLDLLRKILRPRLNSCPKCGERAYPILEFIRHMEAKKQKSQTREELEMLSRVLGVDEFNRLLGDKQ